MENFTPATRLLLLAVLVVVVNAITLVPLAITLRTIAAVKTAMGRRRSSG